MIEDEWAVLCQIVGLLLSAATVLGFRGRRRVLRVRECAFWRLVARLGPPRLNGGQDGQFHEKQKKFFNRCQLHACTLVC